MAKFAPQRGHFWIFWKLSIQAILIRKIFHEERTYRKNYETYYRSARVRSSSKFSKIFKYFELYWTIFSFFFGLFLSQSTSGYLGLFRAVSGYIGLSRVIFGGPRLLPAISCYLQDYPWVYPVVWLSLAISGYFGLPQAISGGHGLSWSISVYLLLSSTISCYLRLYLASSGCL